jgi:hypothetical protein
MENVSADCSIVLYRASVARRRIRLWNCCGWDWGMVRSELVSILHKKREQVADYHVEIRGQRREIYDVPRGSVPCFAALGLCW